MSLPIDASKSDSAAYQNAVALLGGIVQDAIAEGMNDEDAIVAMEESLEEDIRDFLFAEKLKVRHLT